MAKAMIMRYPVLDSCEHKQALSAYLKRHMSTIWFIDRFASLVGSDIMAFSSMRSDILIRASL